MSDTNKICCVIGHREIENKEALYRRIYDTLLDLIKSGVDTFLFGSRGKFNDLCLNTVNDIKQCFPYVRRIYVRAEYPNISVDYERYLLSTYDETYFPDNVINAGKALYVKRNFVMIDKSDICVFYYNENYQPSLKPATKKRIFSYQPKSGTKIAYDYAIRQRKPIINIFPHPNTNKKN